MTQKSQSAKAMILGCLGKNLSADEKAFYRDEQPWGFILFGRNIGEAQQISDLVAEMREAVGGRNAPVLIDQEGGRVQRIREPIAPRYPSAGELGALYHRDAEKGLRAAWLMSRLHAFDLYRLGITVDCLPVLDVPVAGASNVIGDRAYSTDPSVVAAMGRAAASGLKAGGVLPVLKHIPGHGRGMADSHHELPVVHADPDELDAHDFMPFRALSDELMAMSCHVVYNKIDPEFPASTSRIVTEDIIRKSIGFDGLLMSDDISMNALKGTIAERAVRIAAVLDVVLHCHGHMDEMQAVAAAVKPLEGRARMRADAVEAALVAPEPADEQALREEFHALMAVA